MPTTEHIHLPLYTDEETPDLSTTGHYNHAMEIIDANVGELEQKDSELAEDIADERDAREKADQDVSSYVKTETTALGSRIDNAEVEISANSADLTGIKGLTYGEGGQVFLEESGGSYSSPALEEIRHEISDLQGQGGGTEVNSIAPLVVDTAPTSATSECLGVGNAARAYGDRGIAIGHTVSAFTRGIAIGGRDTTLPNPPTKVTASGNSVVIGYNTVDQGQASVVIGLQARSDNASGVAIGDAAQYTSSCGIAIGYNAYCYGDNSVALGRNSRAGEADTVSVGSGNSRYSTIVTRRIVNVTDPTNGQDAATKNYVDTAIAAIPTGGSGLTVIDLGDAQAADVYAEVKAAWPNCVLMGANYAYPAQYDESSDSYIFTTVFPGSSYVYWVSPTEILPESLEIVQPDTTFGALASAVTA